MSSKVFPFFYTIFHSGRGWDKENISYCYYILVKIVERGKKTLLKHNLKNFFCYCHLSLKKKYMRFFSRFFLKFNK